MSDVNESKALLRRRQRELRRAIDARERERFDASIREHLRALISERGVRSVAAFWPFDGEPDLVPLLERLAADGIELALPVVPPGPGAVMRFHAWRPRDIMREGAYGIPEPQGTAVRAAEEIDLIIMPLAAWDRHGSRLGMGAGYYDRCLAPCRDAAAPLRAGAAYGVQEVERIAVDAWDVPLHGVVTEKGWTAFSP